MKYLLFLFLLISSVASGQVYDSAGYVKVKPVIVTVVKKDTVFIAVPVIVRDTVTIYRDTCSIKPPVDTVKPPPTGFTLVLDKTFAVGTTLSEGQKGRGSISTAIFPEGAFKAWYQAGDAAISSGFRSEQQYDGSLTPNDRDLIIELEEQFETMSTSVQGLNNQWHGNQSGTSGSGSMWIGGGQFMFQIQPDGCNGCGNVYQQVQADGSPLMRVEVGKLYKFRYEIRWANNSSGYIRVYINGKLYYSLTGKNCDGRGQYFKTGINLFDNKNTVKVHIKNLKIWRK